MLKVLVEEFITKQLEGIDDFVCTLEEEELFVYVNFSQVLGEDVDKEMTFKLINDKLYFHSLDYGWKTLDILVNNKYFWIDLIKQD